jgi:hypothetical protein
MHAALTAGSEAIRQRREMQVKSLRIFPLLAKELTRLGAVLFLGCRIAPAFIV